MILTGHQPVYLPWLGLFHKIALADTFVFMDEVQYLTQDWNNRNKIKTPHGWMYLTVPVSLKHSESLLIRDIVINNTVKEQNPKEHWQYKHWKSIEHSYRKTPFFEKYADFFFHIYNERDWDKLSDLNEAILKYILNELNINVEFIKMSESNFCGHKSDLILDMCKKLGADINVFGMYGKDYVVAEDFEREGIKIYFQNYNHPVYPQRFGDFLPYMSVIDLMFNCGDDSFDIIMSGNISKSDLLNMEL